MTDDSHEVQRLKSVYAGYESDAAAQWKRHPDNSGRRAMQNERRRLELKILTESGRIPNSRTRILDIGCGRGDELAALMAMGAREENLTGIDLMPSRVDIARERLPRAKIDCGNAEKIEAPDGGFDLVLLFTVFSSILDDGMAKQIAAEARRVLRPPTARLSGGAILWYDTRVRNPWNPHTVPMNRQRIRERLEGFEPELRPVTVIPQLTRRLGPATAVAYPILSRLPILLTHYLGLLVRTS